MLPFFVTNSTTSSFCRPLQPATKATACFTTRKDVSTTRHARKTIPTAAAWPAQRLLSNFFFFTPLAKVLRGSAPIASMKATSPTILVTGASGGAGRRVVCQLLASTDPPYNVVAMTRSRDRMLESLKEQGVDMDAVKQYEKDGRLQILISDMANVPPDALFGVSATISCTGTKLGPVDDDEQRSKYYQGIIFYPPTVLENTPENVEYKGVRRMATLMHDEYVATAGTQVGNRLFNFRDEDAVRKTWGALDDVVMGGVSKSNTRAERGALVFSGDVSTENNGGFASSRTADFNRSVDLSQFDGIQLRVRGDGKRYKFIVRCERKWDGVAFCYSFDTKRDEWTVVNAPFADFRPVVRGRSVAAKIDPGHVISVQLMLSKFEYDGGLNPSFEAGKFNLLVAQICPFKHIPKDVNSGPKLVHLSSAGVTRPQRLDEIQGTPADIQVVRLNERIGRVLDWKLAGEDVIRSLSDLPYTIVRSCALTVEDSCGVDALKFEQGDLMTGRVSRNDAAKLLISLLKCPSSVGKTFEVATISDEDTQTGQTSVRSSNDCVASIDEKLSSLSKDADMTRTFGPFPYIPEDPAVAQR